jgi:hypothetical protein
VCRQEQALLLALVALSECAACKCACCAVNRYFVGRHDHQRTGIKEARPNTKQRTMIYYKTTYEAGTPELASGFLLMPCYNQWGLQAEMFIRSTKKIKKNFREAILIHSFNNN